MTERPGPKPWPGCDTNSTAWKTYCEAWEHCFVRKPASLRHAIMAKRGKEGLAALEHNIAVVRSDYRGEIDDRQELPRLLR